MGRDRVAVRVPARRRVLALDHLHQSFGGPAEYHNTLLFRSENPFDFGTYTGDDAREPAARLYAHAPEYLVDPDTGRWWMTSCGWPGDRFQPVIPGSVAIRELDWRSNGRSRSG